MRNTGIATIASCCSLAGLLGAVAGPAAAGEAELSAVALSEPTWFEFVVPALAGDATAESAIDLSFLSPEPAGSHGFLRPDGERLVDDRGREVRLIGSNICDFHPMPPKALAPAIAKRIRELGMNLIRLHYFDWAAAPSGILNDDMQTLNPEKLDQLDRLVHQLGLNGVYVDLNLHVARGYPDMPEGWDWMGKGLDRIHRPYLESQKQYARDLLTHVNPYTGKAYTEDPAVAFIELNNENTVFGVEPERWASLPERFSGPLAAAWNEWLLARYGSREALARAWNRTGLRGPELLDPADPNDPTGGWTVEDTGLASLTPGTEPGGKSLRWQASAKGPQWWSLQLHRRSVPVQSAGTYTFRCRARAETPAQVLVSLMLQVDPWTQVGPAVRVELTPEWRDVGIVWTLDDLRGKPVRLNFNLENEPGTVELAGLSLREGEEDGLRPDQDPAMGSVPLPRDRSSARLFGDYFRFLGDRERAFSRELREFVSRDLGARAMVIDTQVNYGGSRGAVREYEVSDVTDIHCYPGHPRHTEEEGRSVWKTGNRSLIGAGFASLSGLAHWRLEGRPFSVTEFDLNPPNEFNSETFPVLATLASYQGWSAILDYSWFNFQMGPGFAYDPNSMQHPFHTTGNPAQLVTIPASAVLFRLGLVRPAENRLVAEFARDDALDPGILSESWGVPKPWRDLGITENDAWRTRLALRITDAPGKTPERPPEDRSNERIAADTGEILVDRATPGAEFLLVQAPACRAAIGRIAGQTRQLGDVSLRVGTGLGNGFANCTLVALDGKPVADSSRLLFTTVARARNRDWRMTADGEGVLDWGKGPTEVESVPCALALPGQGWRAVALDAAGRRGEKVTMPGSILVAGTHKTLWYLLER